MGEQLGNINSVNLAKRCDRNRRFARNTHFIPQTEKYKTCPRVAVAMENKHIGAITYTYVKDIGDG